MESKKKHRIFFKIANIITVIIYFFVIMIAVAAITQTVLGYNYFFGSTFIAVETNSMSGENEDSFNEGDMIVGRLLSSKKKKELQVDDVITYWTKVGNQKVFNTQRIIAIDNDNGDGIVYITKGDNKPDHKVVPYHQVVAKYQYKVEGFGDVLLFLQGRSGFLILVVIPSVFAIAYFVFVFIKNFNEFNKLKKDDEKERK